MINTCYSEGKDVLSGWFTGYWMARYKETTWKVCHISMDVVSKADCKKPRREKKAAQGVSDVREFKPDTSGASVKKCNEN